MDDAGSSRAVNILMLEDSKLDAQLATMRLEKAGMNAAVTLAQDRAGFESALRSGDWDLILADYALPDFDGMAALALAKKERAEVPVIFISGRVGEEVAIEALQRGATDYVLKSRLERLVPAVERALKEAGEHVSRLEAQAKYRESENRLKNVINAVPQMIWLAELSGELAYSNQAWQDNVGPGAVKWCDPELFHPDDQQSCRAAWERAQASGEAFTLEARMLRRADQTYRWHLVRMAPMEADPALDPDLRPRGEQQQWLGTATDVQDRKLNEEALRTAEKLSVTGRLAASIAHEINNPLESLINLLFLLRLETESNPRAASYLDMTDNELARISAITKQTLQFHRDPSTPVTIDARELLDEVVGLFAARFRAKSIDVDVAAQKGLCFEAILGEIRQVLINLIGNAIDAVDRHGWVHMTAIEDVCDGKPAVRVRVTDNGSGITAEQAEQLFQPFYSTKGAQGTGLGLWVSQGIVEKHGGELALGSKDGVTNATVLLPLKAAGELKA